MLFLTTRLAQLVEKWRQPTGSRRRLAILFTGLLIALTTLVVYQAGGTRSVYPHLMYGAILVTAFYLRILGGLLAGIVAGLAIGPLIPLDVAAGIPQATSDWLLRTGFFAIAGVTAGLGFQVLNTQLDWLQHFAYHDALTGLPNLLALREHIRHRENQSPGSSSKVVMLAFNLVNLAEIVSSLGYKKTELLIRKLARRLQLTFPQASMFARVDSDTFAAIVAGNHSAPDDTEDSLDALGELRDMSMAIDKVPIHIEVSIGLARLDSSNTETDALIPMAKIAARNAHLTGRGVAVYDMAQDSKNRDNLRLLGELRKGIEQGQLVLHYQPKLHLASNQIIGVEALIRWQHPDRGLISPDRFMPLAEHTALIRPLTRRVTELALRQLWEWHQTKLDLGMAINLSTHNLHEPDLLRWITQLIDSYQIPQEKLTLEITESALMYPTGDTVRNLAQLRDRGVRIAIDDFGTGYSCLAYLKRLPVTCLKIDQSFIRQLKDKRDQIIVRTAVDFGRHLGLNVVAEGVETREALDFLRTVGCNVAQGYYIGRPLPAEQVLTRLCTG